MRSDRGDRGESGERGEGPTGVVFDVKRYALHDGPGIRTTVFLKGCPLRCLWCQNPESWAATPEVSFRASRCVGCGRCVEACERGATALAEGRASTDAAKCVTCANGVSFGRCVEACRTGAREVVGRRVTVDEIVAEVERDIIFYEESGGGVTFSGGEPVAQAEFLTAALAGCRARGVHTAVDTSCAAPWAVVEAVAAHTDLFLCDIKHMDDSEHERLTGVGNALILDNIRRLVGLPRDGPSDRAGRAVVIRMPVLSGVNDDDANLAAVAEFVSGLGIERVDLLPYNEGGQAKLVRFSYGPTGEREPLDVARPGAERMKEIAAVLAGSGLASRIGG